jgi:predicted nucleic acid-binding protein
LIVLDASVMVAWLLREPGQASRPQITRILSEETILVPAHWSAEIGNALLFNHRRGRIPASEVHAMVEELVAFSISPQPAIQPEELMPLFEFAQTPRLTFYDAAYLRLAFETGASLATLDDDMRTAAKTLGIAVWPD